MKALVLALLFANLAFLAYVHFVGLPAREAAVPPPGPPIPRLQLAAEVPALGAGRCLSIGPFGAEADAQRALLWLRSSRLEPRLRSARREDGTAYWVSLETPTLQQATRVATRLRTAGVADVEVLPPAADAASAVVSLGLYSERERAERRLDELRAFAVAPTIAEQARAVVTWWIDVERPPGGRALDVKALVAAVPEARGSSVEDCPPVAPPTAAPAEAPAMPPVGTPADAAVARPPAAAG
ncbi:MAG: hypothetical protein ACK52I_10770 [Pseudomonadota bacterium]